MFTLLLFPFNFLYLLSWVFSSPQTLRVLQTWFWILTFFFHFLCLYSPQQVYQIVSICWWLWKGYLPAQNLISQICVYTFGWPLDTSAWMASRDLTLGVSQRELSSASRTLHPQASPFQKMTSLFLLLLSPEIEACPWCFPSLCPTSSPLTSPVIQLPKFISSPSACSHMHLHAPGHTISHLGYCNSFLSSLPIFMAFPSA